MYMLMGDSGTVRIDGDGTVTSEKVQLSAKPTSNPIEGGGNINDHANTDPIKLSIAGIVTSGAGRATLESMWRNCDLLSYRGEEAYDDLLITAGNIDREPSNAGGYKFSLTLQQMQVTSAAYVPISGPSMSQQDSNTKKSNGRSTKSKSENGTTTPQSDYGSYVNSFDGSNTNSGAGQSRSNPSNPGYGG